MGASGRQQVGGPELVGRDYRRDPDSRHLEFSELIVSSPTGPLPLPHALPRASQSIFVNMLSLAIARTSCTATFTPYSVVPVSRRKSNTFFWSGSVGSQWLHHGQIAGSRSTPALGHGNHSSHDLEMDAMIGFMASVGLISDEASPCLTYSAVESGSVRWRA